jgi:hypothetical protein
VDKHERKFSLEFFVVVYFSNARGKGRHSHIVYHLVKSHNKDVMLPDTNQFSKVNNPRHTISGVSRALIHDANLTSVKLNDTFLLRILDGLAPTSHCVFAFLGTFGFLRYCTITELTTNRYNSSMRL